MSLTDAAARARIEHDLDSTLLVEAAAGTGKTTQLIRRIVSVLRSGRTTLDRIIAVTFTEKAAGEMKLRLRTELEHARIAAASPLEQQHLLRALSGLELAHINTIHGFCADLLRERPIEAGVDPGFEVLDDAATERLLEQAFDDWFERVLADPPEGVRRALRRASWKSERIGPREQLLQACRDLVEHRDFDADWAAPAYDRTACIDAVVDGVHALGGLPLAASAAGDRLVRALRFFRKHSAEIAAHERTRVRDYDGLEARLRGIERAHEWQWGRSGKQGPERSQAVALRERVHAALQALLAAAEADLAAKLKRELSAVVAAREALKRKGGRLDFVDLLLCTRDLLQTQPAVRAELQGRFTHLFVDEFQDTDPLQAEILWLLACDDRAGSADRPARGKLFAVGDPKQSIYRFRRADVTLYERIKQRLVAGGAEVLHLTTSFRSLPQLQTAINVAFAPLMKGAPDGSQAEYVALSPYRGREAGQPALVALPVPRPYGLTGQLTKRAVDASYPDAVAAFIGWMLQQSGWSVEEGGERVPVQARHVCLLFRRFQAFGENGVREDKTRAYVRGLEARRIPHVLVGGRSLHGREETIALRAALCAIEWPEDELNVYATLRGPLFAITDEELLGFCQPVGQPRRRLHPLHAFRGAERVDHPVVASALEVLRRLHLGRNRRPIADTINRLLEATRAHAGVAIWPTGEQALANLLAMVDAARAFESRGGLSFRGFVDWLEREAERGEGSEATIVEEGTEGVRLMTIHRAKGLEFPVVVLCDPTASVTPLSASRYTDVGRRLWAQRLCGCRPQELIDHERDMIAHDQAESVRLAYVAATRARDLLVVPVFGDARGGRAQIGWVDLLAPALYPADGERRHAQAAPGCPSFGEDSVERRTAYVQATPESSIRPGVHTAVSGAVEVVWWDPSVLELGIEAKGGVRQQDLLAETPRSAHWVQAHAQWQAARAQLLASAGRPTAIARSVTQLAHTPRPAADAAPIAIERTGVDRSGRPRGVRFGGLVHAVLALVPLRAQPAQISALAVLQQRLLGASDAELAAAVVAVAATLDHPLIVRAEAALECRREVPVMHRLDDGTFAQGVADIVFREPSGWTVVDFKTDVELGAVEQHSEQVRLYMEAVRAATGADVQGALLFV